MGIARGIGPNIAVRYMAKQPHGIHVVTRDTACHGLNDRCREAGMRYIPPGRSATRILHAEEMRKITAPVPGVNKVS